jgi:hypothetical protein
MGYLEAIRDQINCGQGLSEKEIDERINAMSITELLWQIDLVDDVREGKFR